MPHAQETRNTTESGPPPLLPAPMARDKGGGKVKSLKSVGGAGTWHKAAAGLTIRPFGTRVPSQTERLPLHASPNRFCALGSAPVAQLDRAPDYESGGQRFESFRARHPFRVQSRDIGNVSYRRHGLHPDSERVVEGL